MRRERLDSLCLAGARGAEGAAPHPRPQRLRQRQIRPVRQRRLHEPATSAASRVKVGVNLLEIA